jgi:DNA-directed RNA polymerase specialized sigma24 family protein
VDSKYSPGAKTATLSEIQAAINALPSRELIRLDRIARAFLLGTEFCSSAEILNEAMVRMMTGRRRWRQDVDLLAFLIMTMRSIASDSRRSPAQARTAAIDCTLKDGGALGGSSTIIVTGSPEDLRVEADQQKERRANAASHLKTIRRHFKTDEEIQQLIACLEKGYPARETCAKLGWDATHYATVRRRLRRGLAKLFPATRTKP